MASGEKLAISRQPAHPFAPGGQMRSYGLTKARSMGPVADLVERAGGSLPRVFSRADLPLRLIEEPNRLILLKDQLALVECAAREIGDAALAARLSTEAGFSSLGTYGRHVEAMPDLGAAIACASATIGPLLQSSTQFAFTVSGGEARWSYGVTDPVEVGRQKNEMLALGYMLDLVQSFAGETVTPSRIELTGPPVAAKATVESVFRGELARAERAALVFPAELLEAPNPHGEKARDGLMDAELPDASDLVACAEALIGVALLESRPGIDWLARHLDMSRRSLQRQLATQGTSFGALLDRASFARARDLLRLGAGATEVAYELGYSDPAHFSRAFRRWAGEPPRVWRKGKLRQPCTKRPSANLS
jgi:AraC-like DNA-binding protein